MRTGAFVGIDAAREPMRLKSPELGMGARQEVNESLQTGAPLRRAVVAGHGAYALAPHVRGRRAAVLCSAR
jgi:hypothetical protein